jgi:RNA polymerase sigma-70 factor (ECF subfamily)
VVAVLYSHAMPGRPDEPSLDLGAVYRHHHRLVRWMVRGAGVPEHAVDDVTQDVFVAIHRRRAQAPRAELRPWIVGVTRSVCHSFRRGSARRRLRLARAIEPEPAPLPDDLVDGRIALHRLRAALASLAEPQREVFVLMELEGLSAPEVAAALATNLSTVYSRLRLARQRVWAELAVPAEVVARAREAGRPDAAQARRSWALVAARVGLDAGAVAPAAVAATVTGAGWAGGLAIGACLGAAALGGLLVVRAAASGRDHGPIAARATKPSDETKPDAVPPASASPSTPVPKAGPGTAPTAATPSRPRPASDRSPPRVEPRAATGGHSTPAAAAAADRSHTPSPPRRASTLADETELLRRAAAELDAAALDEAARLLEAHAQRFADGMLAEERQRLLAVLARRRAAIP